MIITISGAGCTGKTTLLDKLKEDLNLCSSCKVRYFGEFIRTLFDRDYKDKYKDFAELLEGNPIDVIEIHKSAAKMFIETVLNFYNSTDIMVFDRSILDVPIYLYLNLKDHLDSGDQTLLYKYREASEYIDKCTNKFMLYSPTMYYVRPFTSEVEDDGFRPMSLINRRSLELDLFDKEFLSRSNVVILPDGVDKRLSIISGDIEKYFN